MAYGCGDPTIGYPTDEVRDRGYDIPDWKPLLDMLAGEDKGLAATVLRKQFDAKELAELAKAAKEFDEALAKEEEPRKADDAAEQAAQKIRKDNDEAKKKLDEAKKKLEEARKKAEDAKKAPSNAAAPAGAAASKPGEAATQSAADAAELAVKNAEKAVKDTDEARKEGDRKANDAHNLLREQRRTGARVLTHQREALAGTVKDRIEKALNAVKDDVGLCLDNAQAVADLLQAAKDEGRKRDFQAARDELVKLGLLAADGKGAFRLCPSWTGPSPRPSG